MFPTLRQLTARNKVRMNEGVKICVSSHAFSLKFFIENQFWAAEIETFHLLRSLFDAKLIAGALATTRRSSFLTAPLTGL